jgi:hypothetical protein
MAPPCRQTACKGGAVRSVLLCVSDRNRAGAPPDLVSAGGQGALGLPGESDFKESLDANPHLTVQHGGDAAKARKKKRVCGMWARMKKNENGGGLKAETKEMAGALRSRDVVPCRCTPIWAVELWIITAIKLSSFCQEKCQMLAWLVGWLGGWLVGWVVGWSELDRSSKCSRI